MESVKEFVLVMVLMIGMSANALQAWFLKGEGELGQAIAAGLGVVMGLMAAWKHSQLSARRPQLRPVKRVRKRRV